MFEELEQLLTTYFDLHRRGARATANWIIAQIEKPVKLLARPKAEHPSNYEVEQAQPGEYD